MIVSEVINRVRMMIKDPSSIEYTATEMMGIINDAVSYVNNALVTIKDPECLKEVTVSDNDDLPSDYISMAGKHNTYIVGNKIRLYDTSTPITLRYYYSKPRITDDSTELPLKDLYVPAVARVAAIYALNRNEFDLTQDNTILTSVIDMVKGAKDYA